MQYIKFLKILQDEINYSSNWRQNKTILYIIKPPDFNLHEFAIRLAKTYSLNPEETQRVLKNLDLIIEKQMRCIEIEALLLSMEKTGELS